MGLERRSPDEAHRHRSGGEDADFGENHRAHRQAKSPQRDELAPRRTPGQGEWAKPPQARLDERGPKQDQEHQGLRQRGRDSGAEDPKPRHAKFAEHKRIIGESVERYADKAGDQRRARPLKRGEDGSGR